MEQFLSTTFRVQWIVIWSHSNQITKGDKLETYHLQEQSVCYVIKNCIFSKFQRKTSELSTRAIFREGNFITEKKKVGISSPSGSFTIYSEELWTWRVDIHEVDNSKREIGRRRENVKQPKNERSAIPILFRIVNHINKRPIQFYTMALPDVALADDLDSSPPSQLINRSSLEFPKLIDQMLHNKWHDRLASKNSVLSCPRKDELNRGIGREQLGMGTWI